MPEQVFYKPPEIGPVVWSSGWTDPSSLGDRIFTTFLATAFIGAGLSYGLAMLAGFHAHDKLTPLVAIPFVLVAIFAFKVFGPERHCMCVGERGIAIAHRRYNLYNARETMLFDEVDDVEIESTRIVSDAVSQIYMRTELTFSWIDREGYEVFTSAGVVDEPDQRATPKYDPTAPVRLDGPNDRGAKFGFAAMEAFRVFKDQRPVAPYR